MGTDRTSAALTARARELWEFLAVGRAATGAVDGAVTEAAGEALFAPAVRVIVSPG